MTNKPLSLRPSARLLTTGLLAIGVAGGAIQAKAADSITMMGTDVSYTFAGTGPPGATLGNPPNAVFILTPAGGIHGSAVDSTNLPSIGTYRFGGLPGGHTLSASMSAGGNFNLPGPNNTPRFDYTASDGDNLGGTVTWTLIRDGSTFSPSMVGVLNYTVGAGSDAAFQDAFGAIGVPETSESFDLTFAVPSVSTGCLSNGAGCTLDIISGAFFGATTSSTVTSGQMTPTPRIGAPEPATLGLMVLGLLGGAGAGFARRKRPN